MANKSAQTVVDRQITLETTLPGPVLTGGPDQASSPLLSNPTSASHPPPAHSHQSYNIHQRVRQHQGHPGGRLNHSPSIRQSWLFPTNRASPSTALPETTSVMTLNQRPHHGRTDASPTAASSATAQSVPPSVVMNHKERRNFSGSARSRLTKIDRLSKMMLNPNSSIPTLADGSPAVFANSTSRRRARLSLQPQKVTPTETSLSSTTSAQTSDQISRSTSHSSTAVSLSSVVSSIPHSSNSYPRHIVMRSTSPHRTIEDHLDDTAATDSFSSSLPSTSAFAAGVDPSHNSESFTPENPEKANRHASMPLPKPGWRLYDLPDVDETDSQTDQGDRLNSANGEERFQYSASNASSTTNLENHSCQYHATHTRQNSTSTFYTMTPNASSLDLSQPPSNQMNQSSIDPLTVTSFEGLSQSPSTFSLPPPAPKAIKNTKSPLALRRSSTLSTCSTSPINSPFNKGSFPKSSLLSSTVYSNKTLTEERQKIILEILRTERSYVDGLVVLQTLFYEPLNAPYSSGNNSGMNTTTGFNLNNSANASGSCAGAGAGTGAATGAPYYASSTVGFNSTLPASAVPLLSKKSVGEIFSNFSEILQINTLLLTQLETRICGTTFSTGWESDEDETDETRDQEGDEGSQRSSKNRRGAKQKLEQVMVTVGTQGGEQEQMLVLDTDWSVGDIFIEIAPFLKMYSNYVKTYTSALTHINDCMSRNERFTEFLKATAKKPECKSLDFQAYLMLPVQRIPRYRMLLESLLRHTPDDHPDHRKLQTAFESMEQTANFVNETIRQHEMFVEMVNLQSRITGMSEPLVIPGRVLLKRGNVWKVCRRNIQLREIILFSDCIVWTSPSMNPLDDTLTFHRKVGLENSTVIGAEDPDPTKNAFQIISPEKSSQVYVDTPKEKEAWMVAIRRATQEYLSAKRTLKISITPMQSISAAATSFGAGLLRREAGLWSPTSFGSESRMNTFSSPMSPDSEVPGAFGTWPVVDGGYQNAAAQKQQQQPMRVVENYNAPVWVPDHSATRCMICTEEFGTIFRRKHHCRACGKVVCHSCSSRTILIKGTGNHSEKVGRACDDCIDSMFPEEAEFSQPIVANQISQELLPTVEQQQRRAEGEIARRTSNQSLDGVMIRPEDYAQEAGASIGATGMVRGFVEAGLNRMKSRSGHDNILGTEANSGENTRAYNRRSGSHFANGADNNATQVKECGLCRTEFSMFKWRNVCSQCRRVVCSDCLTKKQIDQLFLMGLQAEREAKARGLDLNAEDITVDPEQQEDAADPQDLTRPGLPQSASDSAVETGTRSDLTGVLPQRSQSFNINDSNSNNNSGSGYGGFGNGWRGIKGNTDSGHGQAEKLCDPCYLGLTDDQIKVLESGGGWQYYQATLSKHQTPGLAAALALSNMSLEDVVENGKAGSEKGAKLVPDAMRVEGSLVRAG